MITALLKKCKIDTSSDSFRGMIFILAILAYVYLIELKKTNSIIRNGKIATGKILEAHKDYRGTVSVTYTYRAKGKTYEGVSAVNNFPASRRQVLVGRYFPVKYDSTNRKRSYMIVSPGDFKVNKMEMPDSLAWMKDYMY